MQTRELPVTLNYKNDRLVGKLIINETHLAKDVMLAGMAVVPEYHIEKDGKIVVTSFSLIPRTMVDTRPELAKERT